MEEIIKRLESGESGRGVEQDIYHALGYCRQLADGTCLDYEAPQYTIDATAVLGIVPPGWDVSLHSDSRRGMWAALVLKLYEAGEPRPKPPGFEGKAPLAARAILIAALKARAAQ